jgi:hypothetical protein
MYKRQGKMCERRVFSDKRGGKKGVMEYWNGGEMEWRKKVFGYMSIIIMLILF